MINWQSALHVFILVFLMYNFAGEQCWEFLQPLKLTCCFQVFETSESFWSGSDLFCTQACLLKSCLSLMKYCYNCCTCNPASATYVTLCHQKSRSAETELFLCCLAVKSMVSFQKLYLKTGLKLVGFGLTFFQTVAFLFCLLMWPAGHILKGAAFQKILTPCFWKSLAHIWKTLVVFENLALGLTFLLVFFLK